MTSYEVAGTTVTMPVQVREASSGTVMYEVDARAAADLLPPALDVVEAGPGRANLALIAVDYRDNDLGSYREIGVVLFVRPKSGGADGTHILHLPVDQPFTCEAGRRIWGFPKTLQRIERSDHDGVSTWTLEMDGELAFRLTLPRGGDDEAPRTDMATYTVIDGVPHVTQFAQWGTGSSMTFGDEGIALELGTHQVAKELAVLGLPAEPVLSTWTEHMQATFEAPQPLDAAQRTGQIQ